MYKFRKISAVIVAAVMLLSFAVSPVSSAQLGFNDRNDIGAEYEGAVGAMAQLGVIIGFPGNMYYPKLELTREQGAKIITYIILGQNKADALVCTDHVYSDVNTDDWSAPSIQWCTEKEIILGYGDNRFGPKNPLTGYQFAKMLLCALELGKQERYVGDTWKSNVEEDAARFRLLRGDSKMLSDSPLRREQAALLAFNAILNSDLAYILDFWLDGDGSGSGEDGDSGWILPIDPDTGDTDPDPDDSTPPESTNPDSGESGTEGSEQQGSEPQESGSGTQDSQESGSQDTETQDSQPEESDTRDYDSGIILPEIPI
ncbi:MAG: S-layer homology domain-containing protein [Clostridia bacterium]|nr:S-layer homology domain-containing protein [Clostridia bacterium]